ncbi:MAG: hypothetical protein ACLQNE_39305 [Thermoguttaceae bacterium]
MAGISGLSDLKKGLAIFPVSGQDAWFGISSSLISVQKLLVIVRQFVCFLIEMNSTVFRENHSPQVKEFFDLKPFVDLVENLFLKLARVLVHPSCVGRMFGKQLVVDVDYVILLERMNGLGQF